MKYFIALLIISMIGLNACSAMTIKDVNSNKEKLVGQEITVKGVVGTVVKIGPISGYSLKDEKSSDKISVSSQNLPKEGDTISVKGVWMKDTLLGYYLRVE